MNRLFNFMQKQYNIQGIGNFISVLYTAAPMIGVIMYVVNACTFYMVAKEKYFPWLSLPLFIGIIIIGLVILLVVFFKFVLPSYYAFINRQTYDHKNPVADDLKKIKQKLGIED